MLKLTTDKHEESRGLSARAELLVLLVLLFRLQIYQLFSVLFSSAYWSMLQAVTNKHSLVRRRLCDLGQHCMVLGNCFFSLRSSHVQQLIDSQWCMVDCVIYTASSSVNVFGTSHVQQSLIASYYTRNAICAYTPPAFDAPVRGVSVGISPPRLVWRN